MFREEKQKEINTFNIQFHRKYDFYCFLEIEISQKVDFEKNFFKALYLLYLRVFKMEKITRKLVSAINSLEFKKYKY